MIDLAAIKARCEMDDKQRVRRTTMIRCVDCFCVDCFDILSNEWLQRHPKAKRCLSCFCTDFIDFIRDADTVTAILALVVDGGFNQTRIGAIIADGAAQSLFGCE